MAEGAQRRRLKTVRESHGRRRTRRRVSPSEVSPIRRSRLSVMLPGGTGTMVFGTMDFGTMALGTMVSARLPG
jgi:hypothetical protein